MRFFIQYERGYIGVLVCAYVGYKTTDMIWFPLSIQAGMVAAFFYLAGVSGRGGETFGNTPTSGYIGRTSRNMDFMYPIFWKSLSGSELF